MSFVGRYAQNPRFSPDTLPGLRLWLDAADAPTVTLSGSNVTQWRDKSGNLRHGTPVNGLTYSTASNGVVFTRASSQYLSLPDNTFPIGSSSFSIFFVFTPTATSYEIQLITAGARGGSIFGIRSGNAGTGTLQTFWSGGANDLQTSNLWAVKQRNIGALLYQTSGARSLWINGVQGASETSGGTSITSSNRIGTLEPGAFNTFDGQFHEVLVFESSLSVTERQQVEAYLAQKWDPVPSPLTIPGCVFWLDAGDRSTLTLSASNTITAWTEKSGANRTVTTNSTGIYSATAMNGRPGIQFSAGNVMTSSTASILGNNLTAFVVFMATSPGPVQLNVPIFVGSSANGYWLTYRGDFQIYAARQEGGAQAGNSYYRNINIPIIMAGVASATLSQQTAFLNGYSTDVVNAAPLSNVGATTIYIPGGEPYWGGPANGMFNGVISEVLLFSNALTTTQRQTIEGYLSSKWGIPIRVKPSVLPAAHAFPLALPALRTFSPLDIDGLAFWLDATDTTTFTLSGSTVTQWRDKTNGFVGTPVGNPVYTTVDGVPAVTFNGTQYIDFGDVADLGAAPLNIFVVSKHNTTGGGSLIAKSFIGIGQNRWALFREGSTLLTFALGADGQGVLSYADTNTSRRVLSWTWDRVTQTLYQNGVSIASGAYSSTTAINTTHKLLVGAYNNGSGGTPPADGYYLNGSINEIVCIFGAMTALQRQQMEGYLAEKWGLRSSMGGLSHPFRFAPAVVLPSQIPGCSLWLDAADASSLTLSGSNVTAWRDKTGLTTLSLTGTPPTYVSNQVRFNSSGRFMGAYAMTTQTTFFAVYSTTNTTTNARLISVDGNGYGNIHAPTPYENTDLFVYDGGAGGYWSTLTPQTGLRMYTVAFNGVNSLIWRNGSAATLTGTRAAGPATGSNISIGANLGGQEPFIGELSELIMFSNTLTTPQRQQMEGYLAWKWGLQANLPSPTTPWLQLKRSLTPVFTPTQIPGCAFWIDAADAASMTLSGSNVTQWRDKSSNGVAGTAVASPVLTTVDGFPAVTFNGSSQYIDFGTAGNLGSNQFHIFTVSKFNTTADGAIFARVANAGDQYYRYTMIRSGGVNYLATQADTGGYGQSVPVTDTTTTRRLLSYSWDRSTITGYQNGTVAGSVSYASTATYTSSFKLLVAAYNNSTGGTPPSDGFYMNGSINEILFYFGPLTTAQRQRVEGYLAEKWGLRGSLGGLNHPSRFGPPVILPTQISGCVLWLDAADATTFTLSGSNVTQWRDKSGNGRNFTRAGAADRLTRITVDGNPVVYFNSDGVFGGSSNAWMTGTVPFSSSVTVLKVFTPIVFSPYNNIFWSWAWTADQDRVPGVRGWNGTPDIQPYVTYFGHNNNRIALTYGTPYVSFVEFTGGGANTRYSINGSTSVSSGTIAANTITPSTFFIGGDGPPSGATIQGRFYLSEFIVFSNTLTDTQRQQVEGYLAWKWGLQATLPTSTHPYRTVKP